MRAIRMLAEQYESACCLTAMVAHYAAFCAQQTAYGSG
jgi:hypothetical protein